MTQHNEKDLLATMLEYQSKLNDVFDPGWKDLHHRPYFRAAMVEGGEAVAHMNYKWWKKPVQVDLMQVFLEVVDIFHFILSEIHKVAGEKDAAAWLGDLWDRNDREIYFDGKTYSLDNLDVMRKFDLLIGLSVSHRIDFELMRDIIKDLGFSFSDVYRVYAGKNVLNLFRQHNGDKLGTYIKIWSGREDNEFLADLMEAWTPEQGMDYLYAKLEELYKEFAVGE